MSDQERNDIQLANNIKALGFWVVVLFILLVVTAPKAQAYEEVVTAAVVESTPWFNKNRQYTKQCFGQGPNECEYVPAPPQYYRTTFQNGQHQITILTQVQFPVDVWFDLTRNCDNGECKYLRALPSKYQSPETLAIDEIMKKEQLRYLLRPQQMY